MMGGSTAEVGGWNGSTQRDGTHSSMNLIDKLKKGSLDETDNTEDTTQDSKDELDSPRQCSLDEFGNINSMDEIDSMKCSMGDIDNARQGSLDNSFVV